MNLTDDQRARFEGISRARFPDAVLLWPDDPRIVRIPAKLIREMCGLADDAIVMVDQ